MDLAALATVDDYVKLDYLRKSFEETLRALQTLSFPARARRDALPIIRAASRATIFDGEPGPIVRKYYAFTGDFRTVWFTLDLFTVMPQRIETDEDMHEVRLIVKYLAGALVGEVRMGLREELKI